jgi:hypothetical protein
MEKPAGSTLEDVKGYVGWGKWLIELAQIDHVQRVIVETRDFRRVAHCHSEIKRLTEYLKLTIRDGKVLCDDDSRLAQSLADTVLAALQLLSAHWWKDSCCCLKIVDDSDPTRLTLSCSYAPGLAVASPPSEISVHGSHAGRVIMSGDPVYDDDMLRRKNSYTYAPEVRDWYEQRNVSGIVAWPVRIMTEEGIRPVAALTVEFSKNSGLKNTHATRRVLSHTADQLGLAFQMSWLLRDLRSVTDSTNLPLLTYNPSEDDE